MASLHFSIAYLIEFFIKDKSKIRNLIILTIAIVSTFSTTGYVIVILALFAKLFLKKENKTFCWIIKNSIVLIVLIGAVCAIQYLITQRLGTFSGSVRLDDFRAGFMAWMNHPLMGNGYGNYDAIKHYMSSFRSHNTGFSNSPMYVLALGGVYLFVLYLIMIIKGLYKMIICKDWNSMSFYVLLLTLFTITLIPFNGLTYIMLISMATYIKQQKRFLKYDISQRKLPNNLEA